MKTAGVEVVLDAEAFVAKLHGKVQASGGDGKMEKTLLVGQVGGHEAEDCVWQFIRAYGCLLGSELATGFVCHFYSFEKFLLE